MAPITLFGQRFTVLTFSYIAMHIVAFALAIFAVPFEWKYLGYFAISYFVGMFFITAGYHRYFSHRAYRLDRIPQFILAFMAEASIQKGVLWWAATHRDHHNHSDTEHDFHSPVQRGFWKAHMGWIFEEETQKYNAKKVADLSRFPEIAFISKHYWIPPVVVAGSLLLFGGLHAFTWCYMMPLMFLYQGSYTVNSLAHVWGKRRFETDDHSRNNAVLAIITMGEGWHNNHHYCKSAARQGYKWYEYDFTFYILTLFSWLGVVKDMKPFRAENTKGIVVEAQPQMVAVPKSEVLEAV